MRVKAAEPAERLGHARSLPVPPNYVVAYLSME